MDDPTFIGGIVAGILTLMVFSYLLGANPLWRIAQSLLVGVSVGYVTLVLLTQVIAPQVLRTIAPVENTPAGDRLLSGVPLVLGLLLLMRIAYPGAWPSSFGLNLVVAVGASLAIGGALAGTIVPQSLDTMRLLNLSDPYTLTGDVVLLVGVVCTLLYFTFGVRANGMRHPVLRPLAGVGRWFVLVAFGAILGSLVITFYAALIERIQFLLGLTGL
ncbi:MAG TPA: hypothetical protein VM409_01900 [Chloroflexia bacterium]|nr:hypothetical protein [Chloroflexia bacterium]